MPVSSIKGKFLLEVEPINIKFKEKGKFHSTKEFIIHKLLLPPESKKHLSPHPGGVLTQLVKEFKFCGGMSLNCVAAQLSQVSFALSIC